MEVRQPLFFLCPLPFRVSPNRMPPSTAEDTGKLYPNSVHSVPGSCLISSLRDGGGGAMGAKKVCVPKTGLSFLALQRHSPPEENIFTWVGGWFGLSGWVHQIIPPVDKHIPILYPHILCRDHFRSDKVVADLLRSWQNAKPRSASTKPFWARRATSNTSRNAWPKKSVTPQKPLQGFKNCGRCVRTAVPAAPEDAECPQPIENAEQRAEAPPPPAPRSVRWSGATLAPH